MKRRFVPSGHPATALDKAAFTLALVLLFKFLLFDLCWSIPTTFKPFSTLEFYLTKLIAVLLLLAPFKLFRLWKTQLGLMLLLDGLLIANLMYFRTYYTAIPLHSYGEAGNLADFMGSVYDSLRWTDLLFPISTAACIPLYRRFSQPAVCFLRWRYGAALAGSILLFALVTAARGGFREAYNTARQKAYLCSSMPSIYTVFGSLCYDYLDRTQQLTPQMADEIEAWMAAQPPHRALEGPVERRSNCIVILAESLESWVLETEVEGQEITPCLNRLLKDSTTLYAPHVLTQVKGGRSIDGQLLLLAGLLPINSGTYSSQYPHHTYLTLPKAMHERYHTRNYLLTIDKLSTWNQGPIAYSFGMDSLIAYHDFELTEAFGTHKRTGDGSFLRQCAQKIERGEIWKEGENTFMQLVTYSGHAPFKLPEELKEVHFSSAVPQKMADYMTVARYTDRAIGEFVAYLQQHPRYRETLVVITGDHEGLADYRRELCEAPGGKGVVSDKPYTPFIVLNAPTASLRYEPVMGQVDMYPTLLNLLQLDDYVWKGLGQSILDPKKPRLAVGPQWEVEGEGYTPEEAEHARRAYDISDRMIRFDYLAQKNRAPFVTKP